MSIWPLVCIDSPLNIEKCHRRGEVVGGIEGSGLSPRMGRPEDLLPVAGGGGQENGQVRYLHRWGKPVMAGSPA
jgi:hypothetical protein